MQKPIYSNDGGGMKGLFSAYFMKLFCQDAGINPNKLYDYFNFAGSSIGAILSAAYATGHSPDDMIDFFRSQGPKIFTSTFGTPMPFAQKIAMFSVADFVSGDSFYGDGVFGSDPNSVLVTQLRNTLGDIRLFQLKTNILITTVEKIPIANSKYNYRPVYLSNMGLPGLEGINYLLWESVLASGSAPIYFPPATITGSPRNTKYIDGGVFQNNPSANAYALYQLNDATSFNTQISVLSVGCGLGTVGFFVPSSGIPQALPGNLEYMQTIIDISTTGPQEATDQLMKWFSYSPKGPNYYRFQTIFDPNKNTELDESSPAFCDYMRDAAYAQYANNRQQTLAFIQKVKF